MPLAQDYDERETGMLHNTVVLERCRALGVFRTFLAQLMFEGTFGDSAHGPDAQSQFHDVARGLNFLLDSIGLGLSVADVIPTFERVDSATELVLELIFEKRGVFDKLALQFGSSAAFHFTIGEFAGASTYLAALFQRGLFDKDLPAARRTFLRRQRRLAINAFKTFDELIRLTLRDRVIEEFGSELEATFDVFTAALRPRRWNSSSFEQVFRIGSTLTRRLVPHFAGWEEQHKQARAIVNDLGACRAGRDEWRKYEEICIRALRFMFVPPFRKIAVQQRTEGREQRRDAILPNNQFGGFWHLLREEFESRHIVCEFKNRKRVSTSDFNQLRVYLDRPSIGRFGLLFHRGAPDKRLLLLRRNAYVDRRQLVLLVDDHTLENLLLARVFVGTTEPLLEDMKMHFDVTF